MKWWVNLIFLFCSIASADESIILETAVQDDEVMQDFELELLSMGVDHSQKMKATPIGSDYCSKDCVNLSSSTAVSRIIQAERLFSEHLFSDALPLYEELVQKNHSSDLLCRLVQTHYELGHYDQVIELVKEMPPSAPIDSAQFEMIYLSGLAHKQLGQNDEARKALTSYLTLGNESSLFHYSEAQFDLGLVEFLSGRLNESKMAFACASLHPHLADLSKLYLVRIAMQEGKNEEAEDILLHLKQNLPTSDPLNNEIAYWSGRLYLVKGDYLTAAQQFEHSLLQCKETHADWFLDTLYKIGSCYLKIADNPALSREKQESYLSKAESSLKLLTLQPQLVNLENALLTLGECYLIKARRLGDENAYQAAQDLLSKKELFVTPYALSQAILLRAEAAPDYSERDRLYRQLTQESDPATPIYIDGWYRRGLNDYEEGQRLLTTNQQAEAKIIFSDATAAFNQAYQLYKATDLAKAGSALKYQALASFYQQTPASRLEAWSILDQLIHKQTDLFDAIENKAEIFYLSGLVASQLVKEDDQIEFMELAARNLNEGISQFPNQTYAADMVNLMGHLYAQNNRYNESEEAFLKLAEQYHQSSLAGEAWFWAASSAEQLKRDDAIIKQYKQHAFEDYPNSTHAAEAYLTYYPYREYLQGNRVSFKHLTSMPEKFPNSPLSITAYYLIGLDHKKERISLEGKAIRQKNLIAAIEAFIKAEAAFDTLKGLIPADDLDYFVNLRYRSTLERALSNLAIAEESQGAKKQIYLEYAEGVFKQVVTDFSKIEDPFVRILLEGETYHRLWEESEFWLAHTYVQRSDDQAAERILDQMIDRYRQANITKGYFIARTWFEKGMIAKRRGDHEIALMDFSKAEEAAKGKVFSTDQRLDLKIQQSLCYKELKRLDQSMLLLSQVINDDAISGLRIKAMCLRAELYELQGRAELALKQWEATSKKGGEWGQKAKEKLALSKKLEK